MLQFIVFWNIIIFVTVVSAGFLNILEHKKSRLHLFPREESVNRCCYAGDCMRFSTCRAGIYNVFFSYYSFIMVLQSLRLPMEQLRQPSEGSRARGLGRKGTVRDRATPVAKTGVTRPIRPVVVDSLATPSPPPSPPPMVSNFLLWDYSLRCCMLMYCCNILL